MPRATVLAGSYERFVFGYAHARGAASDASDGATTTTLAKRFTVDAHLASVKAVACAGGLAASGGSDDLIRVYHCDASGGMADLGTCVGHGGDARALEFYAPRGYAPTRLLSGGADGALMVWDASDNFELLKTMRAHRGGVCAISAHRSGKVALTSGCDAHVAMWDMRRGRVAYKFKTPERVEGLAFTCDGSEYVSRLTQKITLTDVEAGSVVTSFTTPAKTLTFDARGRMVYVGCEGGDVLVYDARMAAKEGAVSRIAKAHPQRVRGLAITSAKGDETVGDSGPSALVTAGSEGVVRAWDLRRASGPRDENPGTPVAEINSGARYTCLCAMPAETVPDAPKPKLPAPKPRADAPAKKQADKSSKVSTSKDNKPASSKRHDMKQKKRPDIGGDDDFEVVPEEHEPAAKREPSRFDSDSDGDAPYAKPAGGKKRQKQRQGPAYEKTATSARRKANNIKHKKRR